MLDQVAEFVRVFFLLGVLVGTIILAFGLGVGLVFQLVDMCVGGCRVIRHKRKSTEPTE